MRPQIALADLAVVYIFGFRDNDEGTEGFKTSAFQAFLRNLDTSLILRPLNPGETRDFAAAMFRQAQGSSKLQNDSDLDGLASYLQDATDGVPCVREHDHR